MYIDLDEFPRDRIKEIALPYLIIQGDSEGSFPMENEVEIHNLIKDPDLAIAPNSNHLFPVRIIDLFMALIADFLELHAKYD